MFTSKKILTGVTTVSICGSIFAQQVSGQGSLVQKKNGESGISNTCNNEGTASRFMSFITSKSGVLASLAFAVLAVVTFGFAIPWIIQYIKEEARKASYINSLRKTFPLIKWRSNLCFAISSIINTFAPGDVKMLKKISEMKENDFLKEIEGLMPEGEKKDWDSIKNKKVYWKEKKDSKESKDLGIDVKTYYAKHTIKMCKKLCGLYNAPKGQSYDFFGKNKEDENSLLLGNVLKEDKNSITLTSFRKGASMRDAEDILSSLGFGTTFASNEKGEEPLADRLPSFRKLLFGTKINLYRLQGKIADDSLILKLHTTVDENENGIERVLELQTYGKNIVEDFSFSDSDWYVEKLVRGRDGEVLSDENGNTKVEMIQHPLCGDNKNYYVSSVSINTGGHWVAVRPFWCWESSKNKYVAKAFLLENCLNSECKMITKEKLVGLLKKCSVLEGTPDPRVCSVVCEDEIDEYPEYYCINPETYINEHTQIRRKWVLEKRKERVDASLVDRREKRNYDANLIQEQSNSFDDWCVNLENGQQKLLEASNC